MLRSDYETDATRLCRPGQDDVLSGRQCDGVAGDQPAGPAQSHADAISPGRGGARLVPIQRVDAGLFAAGPEPELTGV